MNKTDLIEHLAAKHELTKAAAKKAAAKPAAKPAAKAKKK